MRRESIEKLRDEYHSIIDSIEELVLNDLYASCRNPTLYNPEKYTIILKLAINDCNRIYESLKNKTEEPAKKISGGFQKLGSVLEGILEYVKMKEPNEFDKEKKLLESLRNIFINCEAHYTLWGSRSNDIYSNPCRKKQYDLIGEIMEAKNKVEEDDPLNHLIEAGKKYLEICKECPYRD